MNHIQYGNTAVDELPYVYGNITMYGLVLSVRAKLLTVNTFLSMLIEFQKYLEQCRRLWLTETEIYIFFY